MNILLFCDALSIQQTKIASFPLSLKKFPLKKKEKYLCFIEARNVSDTFCIINCMI